MHPNHHHLQQPTKRSQYTLLLHLSRLTGNFWTSNRLIPLIKSLIKLLATWINKHIMEHSPHRVVSTPLPLTLPQVISVRHKMVGLGGLTPRVTVVRERHRKGFWALSCLRFTSTTDFNYRLGLPPVSPATCTKNRNICEAKKPFKVSLQICRAFHGSCSCPFSIIIVHCRIQSPPQNMYSKYNPTALSSSSVHPSIHSYGDQFSTRWVSTIPSSFP